MNYQRHRKYNAEFKKLVEKNIGELNKLTGEKRHKLEMILKKKAREIADGKLEEKKEEIKEAIVEEKEIVNTESGEVVTIDEAAKDLGINLSEKPLEEMSVEEIKAYCVEKNIDIGGASSVNGIIKKIKKVQ